MYTYFHELETKGKIDVFNLSKEIQDSLELEYDLVKSILDIDEDDENNYINSRNNKST